MMEIDDPSCESIDHVDAEIEKLEKEMSLS